jgi:hypothetical protein
MDSSLNGISSKLGILHRLGLISENNVSRVALVFESPEEMMSEPGSHALIHEVIADSLEYIASNDALYETVIKTLPPTKPLWEDAGKIDNLLRTGLVEKKHLVNAKKLASNRENLKSIKSAHAYRDLMVHVLDTLAKRITGSPVLFNAFKKTAGRMNESVTQSSPDLVTELELDIMAAELLEEYVPLELSLWLEAKDSAKEKYDSKECINAWAVKLYNESQGQWGSVSAGKTFFELMEEIGVMSAGDAARLQAKKEAENPSTTGKKRNTKSLEAVRAKTKAKRANPTLASNSTSVSGNDQEGIKYPSHLKAKTLRLGKVTSTPPSLPKRKRLISAINKNEMQRSIRGGGGNGVVLPSRFLTNPERHQAYKNGLRNFNRKAKQSIHDQLPKLTRKFVNKIRSAATNIK